MASNMAALVEASIPEPLPFKGYAPCAYRLAAGTLGYGGQWHGLSRKGVQSFGSLGEKRCRWSALSPSSVFCLFSSSSLASLALLKVYLLLVPTVTTLESLLLGDSL